MPTSLSSLLEFHPFANINAAAAPVPTPQLHSSRCSRAAVLAAKVIAIVLPAVSTLGAPLTVIARKGNTNGAAWPARPVLVVKFHM